MNDSRVPEGAADLCRLSKRDGRFFSRRLLVEDVSVASFGVFWFESREEVETLLLVGRAEESRVSSFTLGEEGVGGSGHGLRKQERRKRKTSAMQKSAAGVEEGEVETYKRRHPLFGGRSLVESHVHPTGGFVLAKDSDDSVRNRIDDLGGQR
jgi:hypothetical protein